MAGTSSNNEPSPLQYYRAAKDYLEAAKVIWASPYHPNRHPARFFLPMHLLLGFSLELFLKAWLRNAGVSASELKKAQFGHDLDNLYQHAQKHGFPVDARQAALIAHFSPEHKNFGFRYIQDNITYKPTAFPSEFTLFDEIDICVDDKIRVSSSDDLKPGQWLSAGVSFDELDDDGEQ